MRLVALVQRREMWNNISRRLWIRGSRRILQVSAWLMTPCVTSSLVNAYVAAAATLLGKKIKYGHLHTGKTGIAPVQWKQGSPLIPFMSCIYFSPEECGRVGGAVAATVYLSHAAILDILLAFYYMPAHRMNDRVCGGGKGTENARSDGWGWLGKHSTGLNRKGEQCDLTHVKLLWVKCA